MSPTPTFLYGSAPSNPFYSAGAPPKDLLPCLSHPAKSPSRNLHYSKVFPGLGRGEEKHTHQYTQSQEPNCITGSAEGVLCHSVYLQPCKYVAYLPYPLTNKSLPRYNAGKSSYRIMLLQPQQKDWGQQNSGDNTGKAPYISVLPPRWQMG